MDFVAKSSFGGYTNVGFTGQRIDVLDSGNLTMNYYKNRWYDAETGRFISHDPLGIVPEGYENGFNVYSQYSNGLLLYNYTSNNPINGTDQLGLYDPRYPGLPPCVGDYCSRLDGNDDSTRSPYECKLVIGKLLVLVFIINPLDTATPWGVSNDHFAHCYASCRLAQTCGSGTARAFGWQKEIMDNVQEDPYEAGVTDMEANNFGIKIGKRSCSKKDDCLEGCEARYGDSGGQFLF